LHEFSSLGLNLFYVVYGYSVVYGIEATYVSLLNSISLPCSCGGQLNLVISFVSAHLRAARSGQGQRSAPVPIATFHVCFSCAIKYEIVRSRCIVSSAIDFSYATYEGAYSKYTVHSFKLLQDVCELLRGLQKRMTSWIGFCSSQFLKKIENVCISVSIGCYAIILVRDEGSCLFN